MKINSFKVLKVASEINGMTSEELQVLAECLNEKKADSLATKISFVIQDRDIVKSEMELV
jgi:hypothetical protein